ncbi:MAG: hypothetical protein WCQ57_08320 [Verrucomicrobiota bacterium]
MGFQGCLGVGDQVSVVAADERQQPFAHDLSVAASVAARLFREVDLGDIVVGVGFDRNRVLVEARISSGVKLRSAVISPFGLTWNVIACIANLIVGVF